MNTAFDFSEKITCTGPQPRFSPNNKLVACAHNSRLVVRDVETLAVVSFFSCLEPIDKLAWSPSNDHILCVSHASGTVRVFSLSDPEWTCSISEGLAGVVNVQWSPNGQYILLTSDFHIKLSVWSLVDQTGVHLTAPKHAEAGLAFSPDGAALAILDRADCKDYLTLYETATWQPVARCAIQMHDASDLAWSPDSSCLAVWESPAYGDKLMIISAAGEVLSSKCDYKEGLGVKTVSWSPSGILLAVGSYEKDVDVLNSATWASLVNFAHPATVTGPTDVIVYSEIQEGDRSLQESNGASPGQQQQRGKPGAPGSVEKSSPSLSRSMSRGENAASRTGNRPPSPNKLARAGSGRVAPTRLAREGSGRVPEQMSRLHRVASRNSVGDDGLLDEEGPLVHSRYIIADLPVRLPTQRLATDQPNPKMGVSMASWSPDGSYLATRNDATPNAVWLWHTTNLELAAVVLQANPVRCLAWSPTQQPNLAIASGVGRVYVWSPEGASCVHIPDAKGLRVTALEWSQDGLTLLASSVRGGQFVCAYRSSTE